MNRWSVAVVCALALTVGARAWGDCGSCAKKSECAKPTEQKCGGQAKCDADNDGKVTQAEFMAAKNAGGCAKKKAKLEAKFKAMDKDSDGALSKEECAAGCGKREGCKVKKQEAKCASGEKPAEKQ